MFLLYNFLMTITAPIWVPWMLMKAKRRKEQPNWKERQGDFDIEHRKGVERIWLHAVSVGEVVAATPILRELKTLLPQHEIVLSVTTSSGHQTAREKASELYDHLVYFPLDVPRYQLAAMQRVQPSVVAVMETELWFNFLWAAKTFEAKTLLINGRISDRSFPRSMKLRFFYKRLLENMDRCLMQTEKDAERIKALGAREAEVLGNCKFDQAAEGLDADAAQWRLELGLSSEKPVLVIGSTRGAEEEAFVIQALKDLVPERLQVIHAPRHLERIKELSHSVGAAFGRVALRSQGHTGPYLLLDTYGELAQVYSVADIVIIGGGFANHGGQNLLQPLAHGKPVLHGPHMQNFRQVADAAAEAGATGACSTPEELRDAIVSLIEDPAKRERMGAAARELIQRNLGASKRYAEAIAEAALGNV
jgi:3-deoxy-D-manno-octulosonic-acid transferase